MMLSHCSHSSYAIKSIKITSYLQKYNIIIQIPNHTSIRYHCKNLYPDDDYTITSSSTWVTTRLSKLAERITSAQAIGVVIGLLPNTHNSVSLALAVIIISRSVEYWAVIPDRNIIFVPLKAHLEIMVVCNKLQKIGLENFALSLSNVVDVPCSKLSTGGKKTLPAGYRIRADHRVHSLEIKSGVFWGAAIFVD